MEVTQHNKCFIYHSHNEYEKESEKHLKSIKTQLKEEFGFQHLEVHSIKPTCYEFEFPSKGRTKYSKNLDGSNHTTLTPVRPNFELDHFIHYCLTNKVKNIHINQIGGTNWCIFNNEHLRKFNKFIIENEINVWNYGKIYEPMNMDNGDVQQLSNENREQYNPTFNYIQTTNKIECRFKIRKPILPI